MINLNTLVAKEIMPGIHGKVIHGDQLSWVFWDVEKDAVVPEHHHVHEQMMHVVSGRFSFTLNNETHEYGPGAVVVIPSLVPHSGRALTACKLMDIFTPARTEY